MKARFIHQMTRLKLIFIILLICFSAGCQFSEEQKAEAEIHFIDTGNSDAILIKQGNQAALIDGGDNDDEELIPAYIKKQGINQLDYLFVTHPDADHIGGLDAVVEAIKIKQVYVGNGKAETKTYRDFIEALMHKNLTPSVPLLNSTFQMGNSSFKVMSVAHAKDVNNTSLVLLYINGKDKLLFMGDVGEAIEKNIRPGKIDLLKVGHHGSKNSTSRDFLKDIQPQYAVITAGVNNKYGHPHKETMERLKALAIPVYRTDEGGDLLFISTGNGIETKGEANSYLPGSSQGDAINTDSQKEEVFQNTRVYFTVNGTKYHRLSNCSGMKSPVEGSLKEVGDRTACSKCY